jgi:hypothetical protein
MKILYEDIKRKAGYILYLKYRLDILILKLI